MNTEWINHYLTRLNEIYCCGEAREESYYPLLDDLIRQSWDELHKNMKKLKTILVPKTTTAGNPDMVVRTPDSQLIGYIEAKRINENLDKIEGHPQILRYREVFPNFILTSFHEFRLYRYGTLIAKSSLKSTLNNTSLTENDSSLKNKDVPYMELMKEFFSYSIPTNPDAKELAKALAIRTRFFRDQVILRELKAPVNKNVFSKGNAIFEYYDAFKKFLIHGLTIEDFADLYAQTLTFGLFIAATRCPDKLERETAFRYISQTGGILHDIFKFISMGNIPKQLACSLEDIIDVLRSANCIGLLNTYYRDDKGDDPAIHFYETFLSQYDPDLREKKGVYYTPKPVVQFIVNAVNDLLKTKLNRRDGLADIGTTVLDPAAGTSAFLVETAKLAMMEYKRICGEGSVLSFIRHYLFHNLFGFEGMMAPYAVGHLKMSYILEKEGTHLEEGDRFNLYLTNTLEMDEIEQSSLPGMSTLSEEAHLAALIKKEIPIMVIIGNPPYSGHSQNKSNITVSGGMGRNKLKQMKIKTWIGEKIEDYKMVDGHKLDEKNTKWLQDDYVKFIRFAQSRIDDNGEGIVGFITNHAYLDNPTFRGMRQSLMKSFNEIYILDLHGNTSKKERCPDGSRDENVFDIRQGVAIALMVKLKGGKECKIFHGDVWGLREFKFDFLINNDMTTIKWKRVHPFPDYYLFTPQFDLGENENVTLYGSFLKLTDIFPLHSVGIVTARDELTIRESVEEMRETLEDFIRSNEEITRLRFNLGDDTRDWKVKTAQQDIREMGIDEKKIFRILYRPFEIRYTYFTGKSRGFHCMPRTDVMKHMLKPNLGLISVRQVAEGTFNHCFVSDTMVESRVTTSNKGIGFLFPLYRYTYAESEDAFHGGGKRKKRHLFNGIDDTPEKLPNLVSSLLDMLAKNWGFERAPLPEGVFYYIYGVLYSSVYREKYAAFLKIDFPRIPFTGDYDVFMEMSRIGEKLVNLHLLKSQELDNSDVRFEMKGSNRVEHFYFRRERPWVFPNTVKKSEVTEKKGRVYINAIQYFSGVSEDVWEYVIAGYPVLSKFLKLRRGQVLTHEEIRQFIRIACSLQLTIKYVKEIDDLYLRLEENLMCP